MSAVKKFVFDKRPSENGQCRDCVCVRITLVRALRELRNQSKTRPVLFGEGVKAVREAGKFVAALETADAVLKELGEESA